MSLTLMWCGGAAQSIGGCQTIAIHTDGGCGDTRNQVKNAALATAHPYKGGGRK
jgi:hypothetical protein